MHIIRKYRKLMNMTATLLSMKMGLDKASVSKWERGVHNPSSRNAEKIIQILGIPEAEYYEAIPTKPVKPKAPPKPRKPKAPPKVKAADRVLDIGQLRIYKMLGHSMMPTLWDNEKVIIHTGVTLIQSGKIFVFAYGDKTHLRRLRLLPDGSVLATCDNTEYPDLHVRPDRITIIGQAISKRERWYMYCSPTVH